jgi:hypothetical protein
MSRYQTTRRRVEGRGGITAPNRSRLMADPEAATIPLELPPDEAEALGQFVRRIDYDTCVRFADVDAMYGNRAECDVMWSAVRMLLHQLAEAGLAPATGRRPGLRGWRRQSMFADSRNP